jgi:hypothetical protein
LLKHFGNKVKIQSGNLKEILDTNNLWVHPVLTLTEKNVVAKNHCLLALTTFCVLWISPSRKIALKNKSVVCFDKFLCNLKIQNQTFS